MKIYGSDITLKGTRILLDPYYNLIRLQIEIKMQKSTKLWQKPSHMICGAPILSKVPNDISSTS